MDQLKLNNAVNVNLQNTTNTSLILNHVRELGLTYRSEISKALNLSLPAISWAVDQMIESGYFIEMKIITKYGRKAHEVEIKPLLGVSIGISIELPILKIAKMHMAGRIVNVEEVVLSADGRKVEELVFGQLEYFLKQKQVIDDREVSIVAIIIAVLAAIDLDHEQVYAVLYRNMKELNIKRMLEQTFIVPVFLENNENLAAVTEKYYEAMIPEDNFTFMTVHHGTGYQHLGSNGFAGAKEQHAFELIAVIHQIQRIVLHLIYGGEDIFYASNYSYEQITNKLISHMSQDGNGTAIAIFTDYARLLAVGVANIMLTLNLELVVIVGQLLEIPCCERFVIEPLKEAREDLVPFPLSHLRLTRLGQEAAAIGACQMRLERTILRHFPYSI